MAILFCLGTATDFRLSAQVDVPLIPVVTILVTQAETVEPSPTTKIAPARFILSRSGDAATPLQVRYELSGSATPGADYSDPGTGGVLTIPAGVISQEFIVAPMDDDQAEGDETVVVTLLPAVPGKLGAYGLSRLSISGRMLIHDNDRSDAALIFHAPLEGQGFESGAQVNMQVKAVDPDGYLPRVDFLVDGRVVGVSELNFLVAPKPGTPIEHVFNWVANGTGKHVLQARAIRAQGEEVLSNTVTIEVNAVSLIPVATIETTRDRTVEPSPLSRVAPAALTVRLDPAPKVKTQVWLGWDGTALAGVDYQEPQRSVEFEPGQTEVVVEVFALDDSLVEGPEIARATLDFPWVVLPVDYALQDGAMIALPFLGYTIGTNQTSALVVIADNEEGAPSARLDLVQPAENQQFTQGSSIVLEAMGVTWDGELNQGVEFLDGETLIGVVPPPTVKRAPIPGLPSVHRLVWNNPEVGSHVLTARTKLPDGTSIESGKVKVTVESRNIPVVSITHVATPYAAPNSDYVPGYFLIERTGSLAAALPVYYSLGGTAQWGVDYTGEAFSATIPAGESSIRVSFQALDDKIPEQGETILVTLTSPLIPEPVELSVVFPPLFRYYEIDPKHASAEVVMFDNDRASEIATLTWDKPVDGATFAVGEVITLQLTAVDQKADIRRVEFYDGNSLIGVSEHLTKDAVVPGNPRTHILEWKGASLGIHRVWACALDAEGSTVVSKTLNLNVELRPVPLVQIVSPVSGASYVLGETIEIVAALKDAYAKTTRLVFLDGGERIGEVIVSGMRPIPFPDPAVVRGQYPLKWEKASAGTHELTVEAWAEEQRLAASSPVKVLVREADRIPTVTVVTWDAHAVEPLNPGELNPGAFQIRRSGSTQQDLTVWIGFDGTAQMGQDFEAIPGTVTIPAGRASVLVTVTPVADSVREGAETVTLAVVDSPVAGPIPPYRVGADSRGTVVIADAGWAYPGGPGECAFLPDGKMYVCFAGTTGVRYRFEVSDDLVTWRTVGYGDVLDGATHWVDEGSAEVARRFYRAVAVQHGEEPVQAP